MPGRVVVCVPVLLCAVAWGQTQNPAPRQGQPATADSMPGMDMSRHDMSKLKDMPNRSDTPAAGSASAVYNRDCHGPHRPGGRPVLGGIS